MTLLILSFLHNQDFSFYLYLYCPELNIYNHLAAI